MDKIFNPNLGDQSIEEQERAKAWAESRERQNMAAQQGAAGLQGGCPPGWHATARSGPPCCKLPPGWLCTRNAGHPGACMALEMLPNWQRAWNAYAMRPENTVTLTIKDSFKTGYEAGFAEGMRCPF